MNIQSTPMIPHVALLTYRFRDGAIPHDIPSTLDIFVTACDIRMVAFYVIKHNIEITNSIVKNLTDEHEIIVRAAMPLISQAIIRVRCYSP
jgi:hypothetical protein